LTALYRRVVAEVAPDRRDGNGPSPAAVQLSHWQERLLDDPLGAWPEASTRFLALFLGFAPHPLDEDIASIVQTLESTFGPGAIGKIAAGDVTLTEGERALYEEYQQLESTRYWQQKAEARQLTEAYVRGALDHLVEPDLVANELSALARTVEGRVSPEILDQELKTSSMTLTIERPEWAQQALIDTLPDLASGKASKGLPAFLTREALAVVGWRSQASGGLHVDVDPAVWSAVRHLAMNAKDEMLRDQAIATVQAFSPQELDQVVRANMDELQRSNVPPVRREALENALARAEARGGDFRAIARTLREEGKRRGIW